MSYPNDLVKVIKEGGYPKEICSVEETGVNGEKMTSRTFIARKEKSTPGFKVLKDRMTLVRELMQLVT